MEQSLYRAPKQARVRAHETVVLSCPHCWGTGDMALFDNVQSKRKRDCIFCEGKGQIAMEVAP